MFAPVWGYQGWRSHLEAAEAKRTSLTCPNRAKQLKQAFGDGTTVTKAFQDRLPQSAFYHSALD
jgi:hypothetical protein